MTTICLLPGIAASLLPFHRDFRSSCAIFRRPRKPQKRRPDGFTKIQPCGIFGPPVVTFRRPAVKLQKRRPGGFSKIQPCEASVVVFALPASTEGNCLSLAKQGEFARMDAKKACENDRKRSRWIGRTRPGAGGAEPDRAPGVQAPGDYSVMEANSCRNAEFQ